MTPTRSIPEPVKRQLRQEAGFGCCVCGHPFFEYHHMAAFAEHPQHDSHMMMVLCPTHHHQATVGALTRMDQERSKAAPFNIANGYVNGQLTVTDPCLAIQIASNQFVGEGVKLVVDGEALVELHRETAGGLSISLNLFDENDTLLAVIQRNEWIAGDPLPWDLEFGYRWIKVRKRKGEPALFIDARTRPVEMIASLWRKGQHFQIQGDLLKFNGVVEDAGIANLALVGLMLDVNTATKAFAIKADPAIGRGTLVSWPDLSERLEMAFSAYAQLKGDAIVP